MTFLKKIMTSCVDNISRIQCRIKIMVKKPRSVPEGHKAEKVALETHRSLSKDEYWRALKLCLL